MSRQVAELVLEYKAATSTGWKQAGQKISTAFTTVASLATGLSVFGIATAAVIASAATMTTTLIETWSRDSDDRRAILERDSKTVSAKLPELRKVIKHAQSTFDKYGTDLQDKRMSVPLGVHPQKPCSFYPAERDSQDLNNVDASLQVQRLNGSGAVLTGSTLRPAPTTVPSRVLMKTNVGCTARDKESLTRAMEDLAQALSTAKDNCEHLCLEEAAIRSRLVELDRARHEAADLLAELRTADRTSSWWKTFWWKVLEWLRLI
jgi:hypothetical protein